MPATDPKEQLTIGSLPVIQFVVGQSEAARGIQLGAHENRDCLKCMRFVSVAKRNWRASQQHQLRNAVGAAPPLATARKGFHATDISPTALVNPSNQMQHSEEAKTSQILVIEKAMHI